MSLSAIAVSTVKSRRPWTAEPTPNCFIVRDANSRALSYVYFENEPGRRSAAKLLSEDEARRIEYRQAPRAFAKALMDDPQYNRY